MTFDLRCDPDVLGDFVANARTLVHEAKIHVDADGLHLAAVDPANVGMIRESVAADEFESYDADGETVIGVNLERLADVLGMLDGEARVQLDDRTLVVSGGGMEFSIATIDTDSIRQEPDIPELDLPATVRLDASRLDRALKAADLVADRVTLGASAELGVFYAEADGDTDDVRDTVDGDALGEGSTIGEDVESIFSLDYLNDVERAPGLDGEVTLELGDEFPVKLHADGGDLTFMVAPRIESQ